MTLQEKIDRSKVIFTTVRTRSSQGLMTGKKRRTSVIYFLLLASYTIINNFILKDPWQLGYTMFLIIGNLITFFMLTFMSESIFSKQHVKTYKIVNLINKSCKLAIFVVTFIAYLNFYQEYFKNNPVEEFFESYGVTSPSKLSKEIVLMLLENIILADPAKFFGIIVTVFTGVPVLIYFLCVVCKSYIYILFFPFAILHWLFSSSRVFYQYEYVDEERVRIVKRKIDDFGYSFVTFIKKIFILIFGVFGIYIALFIFVIVVEMINGDYTTLSELLELMFQNYN